MQYESGENIILGDIVETNILNKVDKFKVVMIGETGEFISLNAETAKWAIESGHVGKENIMIEYFKENPLAHNNSNYAPVSNTISTDVSGIVFSHRSKP